MPHFFWYRQPLSVQDAGDLELTELGKSSGAQSCAGLRAALADVPANVPLVVWSSAMASLTRPVCEAIIAYVESTSSSMLQPLRSLLAPGACSMPPGASNMPTAGNRCRVPQAASLPAAMHAVVMEPHDSYHNRDLMQMPRSPMLLQVYAAGVVSTGARGGGLRSPYRRSASAGLWCCLCGCGCCSASRRHSACRLQRAQQRRCRCAAGRAAIQHARSGYRNKQEGHPRSTAAATAGDEGQVRQSPHRHCGVLGCAALRWRTALGACGIRMAFSSDCISQSVYLAD